MPQANASAQFLTCQPTAQRMAPFTTPSISAFPDRSTGLRCEGFQSPQIDPKTNTSTEKKRN